jgi:hypothetical protein
MIGAIESTVEFSAIIRVNKWGMGYLQLFVCGIAFGSVVPVITNNIFMLIAPNSDFV